MLANANELLSAWSVEVEDLRLRCVDAKAEAATVQELARVAGERDTFGSQATQLEVSAKAASGQLGAEQGAHLLTKAALAEALKVAEASRVEALAWKEKAEGASY